jgi:UDP-glucose 4-epimerase
VRLLITGTNGFIGRNLKEFFQGKHEVLGPKRGQLNLLDTEAVYGFLSQNPVDVLIHCATNIESVEQNLIMYFNIERCAAFFGKMLSVGSGAEYDLKNYQPRMREEYFGQNVPTDVYGLSKFVVARDIESKSGKFYNLRTFGIYGKYENYRHRFISNNICRVLCQQDISINRDMLFDYLFVEDFCRIVERFIHRDGTWRSYNICTGQTVSLLELAKLIQKIDGTGKRIVVRQEGMNREYSGDNGRFLREFGKFAYTQPEHAVADLYRWYKEAGTAAFDPAEFKQ